MLMVVALFAGFVAAIFGAIAGYYIGRGPQVKEDTSLLGFISSHVGVKL